MPHRARVKAADRTLTVVANTDATWSTLKLSPKAFCCGLPGAM
jgi:hypothetical protein